MTRHLDFDDSAISEEDILVEIEKVISNGAVAAAQAARDYYSSGNLPYLIERYFRQRGLTKRNRQAESLGVSAQTLNKIFAGNDISENMLFRFRIAIHRSSLLKNYSQSEVQEMLQLPWRYNKGQTIERMARDLAKIAEVLTERLRGSNTIGFSDSGFSELQKAQLIALLREIIVKLEAPLVNAEETDRALSRISSAIKKNVTEAMQTEAKETTSQLVRAGRAYVVELVKQKGWSVLSSFF